MLSKLLSSVKSGYVALVILSAFFGHSQPLQASSCNEPEVITYYLYISDFANSFIQIPTSNVSSESTTIASSYLAGRAPIYNASTKKQAGTCSASFLSMQTDDGIFTDISNFIAADNGLIVTWFTPTTLINLELDSIIHSMVTECITTVTTKVGFSPLFGQTFDLVVSSDDKKIYFQFTEIDSPSYWQCTQQ